MKLHVLLVVVLGLGCAPGEEATPPPSPGSEVSVVSGPSTSPPPSEAATTEDGTRSTEPGVALSGDCVTPPEVRREIETHHQGVDQEGERHSSDRTWWVSTHAVPDLDGDGQPEMLVPTSAGGPCMWEIPKEVFIMRGDCGHPIGTVYGNVMPVAEDTTWHQGIVEVHTEAEWADYDPRPTGADDDASGDPPPDGPNIVPSHHTRHRVYRFDGTKFVQVSDTDRVGDCHHCSTTRCRER